MQLKRRQKIYYLIFYIFSLSSSNKFKHYRISRANSIQVMQSDDGNDDLSEINENLALEDFQYIQVNITNLGEHSDVFSSNH
jgi:hypothetical protein